MREREEKEGGEKEGEKKEEGRSGKFDEQLHYDRKLGGRLSTKPGQSQQCTC